LGSKGGSQDTRSMIGAPINVEADTFFGSDGTAYKKKIRIEMVS